MARILVSQAVDDYLEHCRSIGKAEATVKKAGFLLRRYARACDELAQERSPRWPQATMSNLDVTGVTRLFSSLKGGKGHRNNATTILRGFFRWAARMDYISTGDIDRLIGDRKYQKYQRAPKYYIPVEDFPAALDAAEARHPLCRAVAAIALYTLCRQSEIRTMRLKDIDLAEREIKLYRSKLSRWTTVGMTPELYGELTKWLNWYAGQTGYQSPRAMMDANPQWYLTPYRQYRAVNGVGGQWAITPECFRLTPDRMAGYMEQVGHDILTGLGVTATEKGAWSEHRGEGMHTIRRSGARAMFDYLAEDLGDDKALLMVSTLLDHEDMGQTLLYIGREIERERLNGWLKGNSMYGPPGGKPAAGGGRLTAVS